tara:strand:- start:39169 stop:39459 length:291 start_codon:yes stop_codon:yes gene_type:complete
MVSEFKEKLTVNNGNWWGDTGRYWHDIGVNRVDIGSISRRERTESASTRSLFECESGTSENRHRSFLQISRGFYGAETNRFRNMQLNKNWTRATQI